jgi:NADH:ubiquinone oxidoreductase subunit 5 (subunit L)/multisubunit Na+/H+ antiporter MnhA subunit
MLERFKQTINIMSNDVKLTSSKLNLYLIPFLIFFFIITITLFLFDASPSWINNFFLSDGTNINNLETLFFSANFVYLLNILILLKFEFISFLYSLLNVFFYISNSFELDEILFKLINFFKLSGEENLQVFYNTLIVNNLIDYSIFKFHYFNTHFLSLILFHSNLPAFFYFGVLFILTTLFSLFLLSYFGFYGVFILNLITIIFFWFSTVIYFNSFFLYNISYKINLGKWFIMFLSYPVYFEIFIDSISYSFMFLTLTIAVFVYIYTFSYFRYEPNVERLMLLINCFVISMICLVTSGNFFVLFLGWELIGLTSFFLINFWSTRVSTLKSAFKAFVFNKFSDVSLLLAVMILFFCTNDINILSFCKQISIYNNFYIYILDIQVAVLELISFFFITCAFIKSAQFGFHIWLPDSMEAPVPASALIHSATLVSAGVFLLLRLSPMFEYSIYAYYIVPIIGSFTAFFGGLCSVYQSDIKRILAYSTISHCGFLMVCYSTYIPEYTVLYLYIHGFFKAAVFLCVGNIIRFSRNYQDFRRMGGFWKYLPFECFSSFICLMNLCGLPFTLGFYIKHLLLLGLYLNNIFLYFILVNVLGGAVFGLVYSYRLFYYVFFDFKKSKKVIYFQSNRKILKSKFYTNTTLASNIAITLLIMISYGVSIYMFNIFLNSTSLGEGLDIYSVYSSQFAEFSHPLLTTINNIGYFNWLLVIIMIVICISSWRRVYNYYKILNKINFFFLFLIFFYIFYTLLTFL